MKTRVRQANAGEEERPLRVLMLVPYPGIRGPLPKHLPLLVEALKGLGCDITTEYWSRHTEHESVVQKVAGRSGDLRRILRRLRLESFDVLYVTTAHTWAGLLRDIPLVLLARRSCPHCVVKFHGSLADRLIVPGSPWLKAASRVLVGACDAVLLLSSEESRAWTSFCRSARFEVVANPFVPDPARHDKEIVDGSGAKSAPAAQLHASARRTLLFVGRVMPEKGVLDLVKAVARLRESLPCRLLVVGEGPGMAEVSRLAEELGIAESVRLLGYLEGEDLAGCYQEADVFVLPTYYAEGFPTVLAEAMSYGLPIITTPQRGAADHLLEGVNALFVRPRDSEALAVALEHLLNDDHMRRTMGATNMVKVREFAPESVAPRYLKVLRDVAGLHSAVPTGGVAEGEGPEGSPRRAPIASAPLRDRALAVAERHAAWLRCYGATSWDQYDFWAHPVGRHAKAMYYAGKRAGALMVAPFVLLDYACPASRRAFWHRQRFPIADAHYAMGFFALAAVRDGEAESEALSFIDALLRERCPGEREYCWGYPFDWETCFGTWKAGTPLITSTPYGYEAVEAAHGATGDPRYLAILESVGRFAASRIPVAHVAAGVRAAAYTPYDRRMVVNASAYRAYLLATAGRRFDRADWLAEARQNLAFVLWSQRSDGSWMYAMDGKDAFIDNFHTCMVLKNVFKAWRVLEDEELYAAVRRGYEFYKANLLDADGLPVPFAQAQRPVLVRRDLYDYAEGINLGLLLAADDADALSVVRRLTEDVLARWVLPDGHFVTRETAFGRNTVPYHRWAQAQMFRALVLAASSETV